MKSHRDVKWVEKSMLSLIEEVPGNVCRSTCDERCCSSPLGTFSPNASYFLISQRLHLSICCQHNYILSLKKSLNPKDSPRKKTCSHMCVYIYHLDFTYMFQFKKKLCVRDFYCFLDLICLSLLSKGRSTLSTLISWRHMLCLFLGNWRRVICAISKLRHLWMGWAHWASFLLSLAVP